MTVVLTTRPTATAEWLGYPDASERCGLLWLHNLGNYKYFKIWLCVSVVMALLPIWVGCAHCYDHCFFVFDVLVLLCAPSLCLGHTSWRRINLRHFSNAQSILLEKLYQKLVEIVTGYCVPLLWGRSCTCSRWSDHLSPKKLHQIFSPTKWDRNEESPCKQFRQHSWLCRKHQLFSFMKFC